MNSSGQLKALIKSKALSLNINPNVVLRTVIFEFFLEKLALSFYANHFIIKGGFLISAITNIQLRTTMDIDVTIKSLSLNKSHLQEMIMNIVSIPTREKLEMRFIGIDEIRENAEYPGFRASIQVVFDGIQEKVKLDFTTGDVLTPSEIDFVYKPLFENETIQLKSYNIETVLAEKLETIYSRGILNTRMRDYYDVYILNRTRTSDIKPTVLKEAFYNTSKSRNTYKDIVSNLNDIFNRIKMDQNLSSLWAIYQQTYTYANDVGWNDVLDELHQSMKIIAPH